MKRRLKILGAVAIVAAAVGFTGSCAVKQVRNKLRGPVKNTIYKVHNMTRGSVGTGFAIEDSRRRKYIVTNFHVCVFEGMTLSPFFYVENEQSPTTIPTVARPVVASAENDLCIVTGPDGADTLPLASRGARPGETVSTMGHPGGGDLIDDKGIVISAKEEIFLSVSPAMCGPIGAMTGRCLGKFEAGLIAMVALPGQSGSPILNQDSQVVGVLFATDHYSTTMYIPLEQLAPLVAFLELLE